MRWTARDDGIADVCNRLCGIVHLVPLRTLGSGTCHRAGA